MADREARGADSVMPGETAIAERPPDAATAERSTDFKGYAALRHVADDFETRSCARCRDARYVTVATMPALGGVIPERTTRPCPDCAGGAQAEGDRGIRAMHADPSKTIEAFDFARNAPMRAAWSILEEVIASRRWVAFIRSQPGTGKTHLSNAALIKWAATWQRHDGVFVTVPDLIDQFRACYREGAAMQPDDLLRWYRERGFVVLDDLGAQRPKDFADEMLYAIIDSRMMHKRATVLSTNLEPGSPEEQERIEPRILSRISAGEVICRGLSDQRKEFEL